MASPSSTSGAADGGNEDFVVVPLAGNVVGELETRYDNAAQGGGAAGNLPAGSPLPSPAAAAAEATMTTVTQTQGTSPPMAFRKSPPEGIPTDSQPQPVLAPGQQQCGRRRTAFNNKGRRPPPCNLHRQRRRRPSNNSRPRNLRCCGRARSPTLPRPPPTGVAIADAAVRFGARAATPEFINGEFEFQTAAEASVSAKGDFKEGVLASRELVAFWFLEGNGSTELRVVHSIAKFFHRTAERALRNEAVGFVGDRTPTTQPLPVKLQKNKPWEWKAVSFHNDQAAVQAFYDEADNRGEFYAPPATVSLETHHLPNMVIIPTSLLTWATATPRTTEEARREVVRRVTLQPAEGPTADYTFLLRWLVAASHDNKAGDSYLTLTMSPIMSGHQEFLSWAADRISQTLGHAGPATTAPAVESAQQTAFNNMLVRSLSTTNLAVQTALSNAPSAATTTTTGGSSTKPKALDPWVIANICAWSGCRKASQLQPIWQAWASTSTTATHASMLLAAMKKYAEAKRWAIETNLWLDESWMEKVVKGKLSTGLPTASYYSAAKIFGPLAFLPYTVEEREDADRQKRIEAQTQHTRTLEEQRKIDRKATPDPPDTYEEFVKMWTTFLVAVLVVFGENCDLARSLREGHDLLTCHSVEAKKKRFTKAKVWMYTWCVIDDVTNFFSQKAEPSDLSKGNFRFPYSLLSAIFHDLQWVNMVKRDCFPERWRMIVDPPLLPPTPAPAPSTSSTQMQQLLTMQSQLQAQLQQLQRSSTGGGGAPAENPGGSSPGKKKSAEPPFGLSEIHPKFHTMMHEYHGAFKGKVLFTRILNAANTTNANLPQLSGVDDICWINMLGRCNNPNCTRTHVKQESISDEFADKTVALLSGGVTWVKDNVTPESARARKRRRTGGGAGG